MPNDINSSDLMVGSSSHPPFWNYAFTWQYGTANAAVELPHLGQNNGASSAAFGVNDAGVVVGYSGRADSIRVPRPVIWQGGAVRELPSLPGSTAGSARAINNSSQIIGANVVGGRDIPVVWLGETPYALESLLDTSASVTISYASRINNRGQILAQGTYNGANSWLLLTPGEAPADLSIDLVALEHGDYPSANWIPVPAEGTTDGNIVRATIRIRNPGDQPVEALLDVAESVANTDITTCPTTITVPPTGTGDPYEVRCTWDTSGFAWSDDPTPQALSERVIRVTLAPVGGTVSTREAPIIVSPRPVFLLHDVNAGPESWASYQTFFQARHPRWPVFTLADLATGANWEDPQPSFSLDQNALVTNAFIEGQRAARDAWQYDLLGHGYGGLVARTHLHRATTADGLRNLILLGTPNLGTECVTPHMLLDLDQGLLHLAMLEQEPSGVAQFNAAVTNTRSAQVAVLAGDGPPLDCLPADEGEINPAPLVGSDGWVDLPSAQGSFAEVSLTDSEHFALLENALSFTLAVFPRLAENRLAAPAATSAEVLLSTAAAELAATTQPRPGYAYVTSLATMVTPGATVELPFTLGTASNLGVLVVAPASVDTALVSPAGQVAASDATAPQRVLTAANPTSGTWSLRLTSSASQPVTVRALVGVQGASLVATATAGAPASDGTRQITATVSDGGAPVTGATVTARLAGTATPIALADDGQRGDGAAGDGVYAARVSGDDLRFAVVQVASAAGSRLVPVVLGDAAASPPAVDAGGPYRVAEGASIDLAATGDASLEYAWDLDGDGLFETASQRVSFSAATLDGPTSRLVRVRASDPTTGLSATSAALVTVENAAPVASFTAPATATVGQPFTLELTGASDPGGDPLSFTFDCGQGFGPAGSAISASCTPTAAGTLTVQASVADDDGGANTYSATVTVSAAPTTGQPTPTLCYVNGAQTWQDFAQGKQKNGKPVQASRSNPALALGLPQKTDTVNFVSLGFGGSLTLRFAYPLVNDGTSKPDLRVWETSFGDARRSWSRYPEAVKLYASTDGVSWTLLGQTTDKDQAYDLVLPQAQYLKLVDVSARAKFGSTDDGFDLDAVEVLSGCVRP